MWSLAFLKNQLSVKMGMSFLDLDMPEYVLLDILIFPKN